MLSGLHSAFRGIMCHVMSRGYPWVVTKNLIYVAKFCQDNFTSVEFFPFTLVVKDLRTLTSLVQGRNRNGLYELPHLQSKKPFINLTSTKATLQLWHCWLGHPHPTILNFILKKFSLPVVASKEKFELCNACSSNKAHRLPFQRLTLSSNFPLQILFIYLSVPSPILSLDKKLYYCIFVDQYTKYTWLYTLSRKFLQNKNSSIYTEEGGEFIGRKPYL